MSLNRIENVCFADLALRKDKCIYEVSDAVKIFNLILMASETMIFLFKMIQKMYSKILLIFHSED